MRTFEISFAGGMSHPELKGIIYCFSFKDILECSAEERWLPYVGYSLLSLEERWIWHCKNPVNAKVVGAQKKDGKTEVAKMEESKGIGEGCVEESKIVVEMKECVEVKGMTAKRDILEVVTGETFEDLVRKLLQREAYWIETLDTVENGLNVNPGYVSERMVEAKLRKNPYLCRECGWRFGTKVDLDEHTLPSKPLPPSSEFFCLRKTCRIPFNNADEVFAHMELDHAWQVFPCTEEDCRECFENKVELLKHLESVHSISRFGTGKLFACKWKTVCKESFSTLEEAVAHQEAVHMKDSSYPCTVSPESCREIFKRKRLLDQHLSLVHGVKSNSVRGKSEKGTKKPLGGFKCQFCPENGFQSVAEVVAHQDSVHPDVKPYQCETCKNAFHKKHEMFRHMREEHGWQSKTEKEDSPEKAKWIYKAQRKKRKVF